LLLDTHIFLWWDPEPGRIFPRSAASIRDEQTEIFVSAVSVWAIAIKRAAGRLGFDRQVCAAIAGHGFALLPIAGEHAEHAGGLPRHHGDPFDRMLVAQTALEGMVLGTQDPKRRPTALACWTCFQAHSRSIALPAPAGREAHPAGAGAERLSRVRACARRRGGHEQRPPVPPSPRA
jgi:PIN domain nuclease of toxin-antitoxin system